MSVKSPSLPHSILVFLTLIVMISVGFFKMEISLHVVLYFVLIFVALNARLLGYSFGDVRRMMSKSISRSLSAIYVFLLIGMVIASFMKSGTVVALIYYGLDWITAQWFLPVGLVLCALMSLATGTSWGTVGTLGVVFIGIGTVLNVPLPLVAGMIVSGATFGDKLSPVSDTTNLASMSTDTDLYEHIKSMLYTTIPTFVIVIILFAYLGYSNNQTASFAEIKNIQNVLADNYKLNPFVTFLPLILLFVLSFKRFAPEVTMTSSIVLASLIAVLYQGTPLTNVANSLWQNTPADTGVEMIDNLLGRGGLYSMAWTLLLSMMAIAMGGVLHAADFLTVLLEGVIKRIKRAGSLVAATIVTGFIGNLSMGETYIVIILNSQLYKKVYQLKKVKSSVLSRSVEEGSTLTTALIPWSTTSIFYMTTMGVSAIDYAPYALLNYINPLLAIVFAYLGIALFRTTDDEPMKYQEKTV
jgi:NhaC family Na+:H+ antiporter